MWAMWGWRGRCEDDGDNIWRPQRPQTMETTWGPSGGYGDDVRTMGTMWGWRGDDGDDMGMTRGRRGPHGDNKITKNTITFERIEIIEFRLKIWDPWALPHTYTLHLTYRWGGVLSQMTVLSKNCSCDPSKIFFPVFALDPIRPYLDWALSRFLTSWPIYDLFKLQLKWKKSAKFD